MKNFIFISNESDMSMQNGALNLLLLQIRKCRCEFCWRQTVVDFTLPQLLEMRCINVHRISASGNEVKDVQSSHLQMLW